jgi:hypothetical protein
MRKTSLPMPSHLRREVSGSLRREYNNERPHTHLRGRSPGDRYHISPRPYPDALPPPEYSGHYAPSGSSTSSCSSPMP